MARREGRGLATRAFAVLVTLRIFAFMRVVSQSLHMHTFFYPPPRVAEVDAWPSWQLTVLGGVLGFVVLAFAASVVAFFGSLGTTFARLCASLRNRRRRSLAMVMTLPVAATLTALFQRATIPVSVESGIHGAESMASSLPFLGGIFLGATLALGLTLQGLARLERGRRMSRSFLSRRRDGLRLAASVARRDPFAPLVVLVGALAVAIAYVPPSPLHAERFTFLDGAYLLGISLSLARYLLGRRAEIGIDGVRLGIAPPLFLPFSAIDMARVRDEGLELMRGRERLARLEVVPEDPGALQETIHRVELARSERERAELARASLALSGAVQPASGDTRAPASRPSHAYRQGALSAEELWRLVEAGATPPDLRVRAATRLAEDARLDAAPSSRGDASRSEITRLRIAAETCLSPGVREALEALLDDEVAPALAAADLRPRSSALGS